MTKMFELMAPIEFDLDIGDFALFPLLIYRLKLAIVTRSMFFFRTDSYRFRTVKFLQVPATLQHFHVTLQKVTSPDYLVRHRNEND